MHRLLASRADHACRYCLKEGYGTRLIPQGTITAAHFVRVRSDKVSYVQVTGSGDVRIIHVAC